MTETFFTGVDSLSKHGSRRERKQANIRKRLLNQTNKVLKGTTNIITMMKLGSKQKTSGDYDNEAEVLFKYNGRTHKIYPDRKITKEA